MMEIRVPKKLKKKLGSVPLTATDAPIVSTYAQIFSFFSRIIRINDSHFQPKKRNILVWLLTIFAGGGGFSTFISFQKREEPDIFILTEISK
jgi:hypothetical protein